MMLFCAHLYVVTARGFLPNWVLTSESYAYSYLVFLILFYIVQYLHPLSLPDILSLNFYEYFPNKWCYSRNHRSRFRAYSWRMFPIDIENFVHVTRSILPHSSIARNLVQGAVCCHLSQIPLLDWK